MIIKRLLISLTSNLADDYTEKDDKIKALIKKGNDDVFSRKSKDFGFLIVEGMIFSKFLILIKTGV